MKEMDCNEGVVSINAAFSQNLKVSIGEITQLTMIKPQENKVLLTENVP